MTTRRKILRVHELLERAYGARRSPPGDDPLDELIATILSQNTSDVNSGRAFDALKAAFPTWEAAMGAPVGRIAAAIRSSGLANIKAPRIRAVLRAIWKEQGHFNIAWLRRRPPEEVRAWLGRFPGIGPKTVACVMLFSLGLPAFPVDTHVFRVGRRLGILDGASRPETAPAVFEAAVPASHYYCLHVNMIRHGREVCMALRPRCPACPLRRVCDFVR
jgi:endonuclease-3